MEKLLVAFTVAVISVVSVEAVCDSSTSSKIQACVFQSGLFNPASTPKDEQGIATFCKNNMNSVADCMKVHVDECADNPKEQKLMDLLVDIKATREGLVYMCNNITVLQEKVSCFSVFGESDFSNCLQDAVGAITNNGQSNDLKSGLDMVCSFFNKFTRCFTNPFTGDCAVVGQIYGRVFEGVKYPYCKMTEAKKQMAIREYQIATIGGAGVVHYSMVTLLSGLIALNLM